MADIVDLEKYRRGDLPPHDVLDDAMREDLTDVVIVGRRADGSVMASSSAADPSIGFWLLHRAASAIVRSIDGE